MHNSYLEFGFHVEDLLFKGVTVSSVSGMVGLCVIVAVFTFLYESVKILRQRLATAAARKGSASHPLRESNSERSMLVELKESHRKWNRIRFHLTHALLYMLQVTMGYCLMLIIMSYNAWLAVTIFTTAGFSYYFFSTFILSKPSVVPIEIISPDE